MGCDEFGVAAYERLRGRMYAHREVEGWEDRIHQFGKEAGCWCEPTLLVPERRPGSTSDARKRNAEKRATAPFAVREDEYRQTHGFNTVADGLGRLLNKPSDPEPWHEDFPEPEWHKGKDDDTPDDPKVAAYFKKALDHDPVARPAHYTHSKIEVWDAIDAWGLSYPLGNVVKYVARADRKGNPIQDLEKARAYLNREIERRQNVSN